MRVRKNSFILIAAWIGSELFESSLLKRKDGGQQNKSHEIGHSPRFNQGQRCNEKEDSLSEAGLP